MREKRPRGEMDPTGCSEGLTEACADSEMYRRVHLVTYGTVKVINMDNYGPSFELSSSKLLHLRSGSTKTSPHFMIISNFHVYPTPTYLYRTGYLYFFRRERCLWLRACACMYSF